VFVFLQEKKPMHASVKISINGFFMVKTPTLSF